MGVCMLLYLFSCKLMYMGMGMGMGLRGASTLCRVHDGKDEDVCMY